MRKPQIAPVTMAATKRTGAASQTKRVPSRAAATSIWPAVWPTAPQTDTIAGCMVGSLTSTAMMQNARSEPVSE